MSALKNLSVVDRRTLGQLAAGVILAGLNDGAFAKPAEISGGSAFSALRDKPLSIGMLIFPKMDQIDFTGPFSVLARMPHTTIHVIGPQHAPVVDHLGVVLTPTCDVGSAPAIDLLVVTGGPGQEALMDHWPVLDLISHHAADGKAIFSVCTGALICGAAGILRERRATTHWAAFDLLPYFGAVPVRERVVVDGNLVSAAGLTAGIDGALKIAALLRGDQVAQQIQLDLQYAPEPPFHTGVPESAPAAVLAAVKAKYQPVTDTRRATAEKISARLGLK